MKKILSVSILAMLTVAPLAANATDAYSGVTEYDADATKVITASYVKQAYNAAIGNLNAENVRATGAEDAINAKIGTADTVSQHSTLYKTPQGGGAADVTVYGNLEALEAKIDQVSSDAGTAYVTKTSASAADSKGANQTLHYAIGNGDAVGSNLAALDAQVYTNKTGIDTLTTNTTVTNAGNYLTADGNVAANLGALDTQVKKNTDALGATQDSDGKVTNLGGSNANTNFASTEDTVVKAINVLDADMGKVSTLGGKAASGKTNLTNDDDTLVEAVNELDKDMGYLGDLSNDAGMSGHKGSVVEAINAVAGTVASANTNSAVSDTNTHYIGASHSAGTVSTALTALDTQVYNNATNITTNANAIGTIGSLSGTNQGVTDLVTAVNNLDAKVLTVYSGWNNGGAPTASTDKVSLAKPAAQSGSGS